MAQANIRAVITAQDQSGAVLKGFSKNVDGLGNKIAGVVRTAGAALAAATTAATVFGIKTAASLESSRQGFVTLLGSAEAADKTMDRIKKEAARTPFEIAGLTTATQMLTAVTKDGDRALDFILNIGEGLAAMGRGQAELDRVAVNIQQIAATGRAFGIDIRQFAFAGIPIYEMLTEKIGLTGEALQDFIEGGGVTFELLEEMFRDSTAEGGRWANAFENQAGTFNQLFSNMKDSMAIFFSDFVKGIGAFDLAKRLISGLTDIMKGNNKTVNQWVENIKNVGKQIGDYLGPKLERLWTLIQDKLIPAISEFWHNYLEPLVPIIGTTLVVAIGAAVDVLSFLIDNIGIVGPLLIALGSAILGAKVLGAFVQLKNVIFNVSGKFSSLIGFLKSPATLGAWGALAGVAITAAIQIATEWNNTKKAIEKANAAADTAAASIDKAAGKFKDPKLQNYFNALAEETRGYKANTGFRFSDLFQLGGAISRGQTAIVGERRPEIFQPREAGRIVPQPRMGGGGNQTINLNVNIGMYAGTEMEKRKIAESLMRAWQDLQQSRGMA